MQDVNCTVTVSVIMLCFNQAAFIREAVEGVLRQQTTFRFELLIGDDASTDGTAEIIDEYARRRPDIVRAVLRSENVGSSRNAYELYQLARGKYLASCEGDDCWTDSEKLQIQVSFLEKHPEYSGCVHPVRIIDHNGQDRALQKLEWVKTRRVFTFRDFDGFYQPAPVVALVRRNPFLNKNWDQSMIYRVHRDMADRTNMLLCLAEGNIRLINRTMAEYRVCTETAYRSATTRYFRNNPFRSRDERTLLHRLEGFASLLFGREIRFERRRRQLFANALLLWLFGRGPDGLCTVRLLWQERRGTLGYIAVLPWWFVHKVIWHLRYRIDGSAAHTKRSGRGALD